MRRRALRGVQTVTTTSQSEAANGSRKPLTVSFCCCPSVCPSHEWISQRRLKLGLCNFQTTVFYSNPIPSVGFLVSNLSTTDWHWMPQSEMLRGVALYISLWKSPLSFLRKQRQPVNLSNSNQSPFLFMSFTQCVHSCKTLNTYVNIIECPKEACHLLTICCVKYSAKITARDTF